MWRKTSTGLSGLYDAVNIKLDKAGGLTAALALHRRAREMGFGIMVGCMVGTSLAMARPCFWRRIGICRLDAVAARARPAAGLVYHGSLSRRDAALWG